MLFLNQWTKILSTELLIKAHDTKNYMKDQKILSHFFALPFLFLFSCIFFISLTSCTGKKNQEKLIVLQVDDYTLTAKEFGTLLKQKLSFFDPISLKSKPLIKKVKERVIEEAILKGVTLNWARKKNVFVRKEDLEKEIQSHLKSYTSDLAFRETLIKQRINFHDWKKAIHFSLLQKLIHKKITQDNFKVTEKDLKDYYKKNKSQFQSQDRIHLRQIVSKTENEAKMILEKLKKGGSFEELAKTFSITPESKKGGDMGWIFRETLPFFNEAFYRRLNQRSSIVKSPYGYHIYEVLGKKRNSFLPFFKVKDKILKILREEKEQGIYSEWLKNQIESAKILKNTVLIEKIYIQIGI